MSQRSKNLLEAFNDSSKVEKAPDAAPAKRRPLKPAKRLSFSKVGGPFADGSGPKPKKAAASSAPAAARPPASVGNEEFMREFLTSALPTYVGIALVFFLLGRASVTRVDASDDREGGNGGQVEEGLSRASLRNPAGTPGVAGTGGSAADAGTAEPSAPSGSDPLPLEVSALHDPDNKCTILAAQYALTESARDLGWNAYAHLKQEGFPVFPLYQGERKYQLFVGASDRAAPTWTETLSQRSASLPGPSGRARTILPRRWW